MIQDVNPGRTTLMQITLYPYERQALEALERSFAIDREIVVALAKSLNELSNLFKEIVCGSERQFNEGRVVLMGLSNHTHCLLNGGMQALQVGNGAIWSASVRGLIEIYGACILISEHPDTAPNFLEHVKAGKLRAAAVRVKPGLKNDIYRLNQIVHPSSGAIYAGVKPICTERHTVNVGFGLKIPAIEDAREATTVLADMMTSIIEKLRELSARNEVLSAGKPTMIRSDD